jgi:hypothetical protein
VVYGFVFGHILRGGPQNFAYFLMVGILPWNFFAQSLMMSTGSILDNGNLIRKVAIPMEVFPVATVLFNLAQYLLALVVFFPMAFLFFKVSPASPDDFSSYPVVANSSHWDFLYYLDGHGFLSRHSPFHRDPFNASVLLTPIIYDIQTVAAS